MRRLLVVLGVAAMIGLAVPAHADPGEDTTFLAALRNVGITYTNADRAVAIGRGFCALMDYGKTAPELVNQLTVDNPGLALDEATRFAGIAVSIYCPQRAIGQR